jgi:hypothetical protein
MSSEYDSDSPLEESDNEEPEFSTQEFYEMCKKRIRVHPRNRHVLEKLGLQQQAEAEEESKISEMEDTVAPLSGAEAAARRVSFNNTAVSTFEPRSAFLWYLVTKK